MSVHETDRIVLTRLRDLLRTRSVEFAEIQHGPTRTSEESARARNEPLRHGGKALLLKFGDCFRLFVLPADRSLESARVRDRFGVRRFRFASVQELTELTGLVPGSVPPFGAPILPFELYVDSSIRDNERIAFNAGSLTDSVIMSVADYLAVAEPADIFDFSELSSSGSAQ